MITSAPRRNELKIPLRVIISFPFILLTVLIVSAVSYLGFYNGRRAVNDVATRLRYETSARIETYLVTFLETPHRINQLNANALSQGWLPADNPAILERHFWEQIHIFESVSSIYFGNPDGGLINAGREGASGELYVIATENFTRGPFHKYTTDSQGQRVSVLSTVPDFDARTRLWYTGALERGATWSDVYILFTGQDMAIAASRPVYADGELLGVASSDLFLSQIDDFLRSLQIGETGAAFIMERSGLLIADSIAEKVFISPTETTPAQRLRATESRSPLISAGAAFLAERFDGYAHITQPQQLSFAIAGQQHFLHVAPLPDAYGIDWLVVVVIPESDFMAQIITNNRTTGLAIVATLLLAVLLATLIGQRVTAPVAQLHLAAQQLAQGQPAPALHESRIAEIGGLTRAFTTMAVQLQDLLAGLNAEIAERKQAEAALRFNSALLQGILESSAAQIFAFDPDFYYLGFNHAHVQAMQVLYGNAPRIGHSFYECQTVEEDRQASRSNMERTLRGEQFVVQTFVGDQTLTRRYFEISHNPIRDEIGEVIGVAIFAQDITERKQAEEALRDNEARYRALFEGSPHGILVADKDTQQFTFANLSMCELLGYSEAALLQLAVADIHPPAVLPQVQMEFAALASGEKTVTSPLPMLRQDGSVLYTEIAAAHLHLADRDYLVGFFTDVTARLDAEASLAQEQILLRTVIDYLPDAIYVKDRELRKLLANHADLDNMGFADESAALGKTDFEIYPHAIAELFARDDRAVLESGVPILDREERLVRPASGEARWLLTSKLPLYDAQGQAFGIIGIGRDITDRKQAQEALRASEELFQQVVRTITAHIYVVDITPDGQRHQVYFSPNRSVLTGYLPEIFSEDVYFWINQVIHPEDRPRAAEQLACLMRGEDSAADYRIIREDGEVLWVRDSARALRQPEGGIRIYGIVSDVTAYKQVETALRESETRFRQLYEQSPVAYQSLDAEGRLLEVNAAWLAELGYTREEVSGRKFSSFLVDESATMFRERFADFKRAGQIHAVDYELRRKDNSVISVSFEGRVGRFPNGKFAQAHCIFINITERKRMEQALEESRALFRSLVESIPHNIFSKDLEGRFTFANQHYCDAQHKALSDILGKTDVDLHPRALAEQYRVDDRDVIETRQVLEKEEVHQTLGGEPIYVQVIKAPIYDAAGQVNGMLGIFWDITERKRAEALVQLQALVLDQIQDRVTITDLAGIITYVNRAEVESLGYAREELIGSTLDLYGDDPTRGATQADILQRTLADGHWRGEVVNYTADKHELILDARTQIVYDAQGHPIALCGIATDITERKRMEDAQRASEERLSLAVRAGRVGIWERWPLADITYYNDSWYTMLGYQPYAMPQSYATWRDLLHPEDGPAAEAHVQASLASAQDFSLQFRMRAADNAWRWIHANGYVTEHAATGAAQRAIGTHTDITEYKQIETALRTALQEREALLREIHHRVKNNLQVVCALLDLQALRADTPHINAMLEESGQRIRSMALIHEQLTHAENLARVNMATYIRDLVGSLRVSYGAEWIEVKMDVDNVALPFDAVSPCGLLINELVSNAFKHAFPPHWRGHQHPAERHGILHITLHTVSGAPPCARLMVADNGIGLPEDLPQATTASLGMMLIDLLVRQLDGELQITAQNGTVFTATFPIEPSDL